jgi:hypothetical protein
VCEGNKFMMQIIHCVECGGSDIRLGSTSVDIVLNKHNHCDKCYKSHTEKQTFFFCSEDCFLKHMKKVVEGTAKIEWRDYSQFIKPMPV